MREACRAEGNRGQPRTLTQRRDRIWKGSATAWDIQEGATGNQRAEGAASKGTDSTFYRVSTQHTAPQEHEFCGDPGYKAALAKGTAVSHLLTPCRSLVFPPKIQRALCHECAPQLLPTSPHVSHSLSQVSPWKRHQARHALLRTAAQGSHTCSSSVFRTPNTLQALRLHRGSIA